MPDSMVLTGKIGEEAKVWTVVLKESNASGALVPKDLTGYTALKLQVEKSDGTVIMNQVACALSVAASGVITCTTDLTVAVHPALIPGNFLAEFSGLNAAGKKRYWPINQQGERTYGKCIIQVPLA